MADPSRVYEHEGIPPAESPSSKPPKVERRVVGASVPPAPDHEPKREYKPDRAWDKLLLVVGAVAVVVALLVVPGILNRDGQNPVAAAAEATTDSPGVRMTFSGRFSGPLEMTMSGRGAMNGETNQAALRFSMTGTTLAGTQALTFDEVIDDGDLYMHSPQLAETFGAPGRWLLLRSEVFGDLLQGNASGAGMSGSPTQQLDALKDASYKVDEVGQEQVNGVSTTHYSALLDIGKLTDQLKSEASGEFGDSIERSMDQVMSATVDVWIDGDGLIRRETSDTSMGSQGIFTMTIDFSDYGARPEIHVPASSEVFDLTPLMQRALDEVGS
jgi:hypothetical protein